MRRIAMNMESAMKERGFCVLSWALLLRAPSEASDLVRAQELLLGEQQRRPRQATV